MINQWGGTKGMNTQSITPLLASYDVTSQGNRLMYMYELYSVSQGWTWALVDSRLRSHDTKYSGHVGVTLKSGPQ